MNDMNNNDNNMVLNELKELAGAFVTERDWHQFHNAKNLSMNLAVEAGELMEHFLWIDGPAVAEHFEKNRTEIEHEMSDVLLTLLLIARAYNVDMSSALKTKLIETAKRYPVNKAKGRIEKYTKL